MAKGRTGGGEEIGLIYWLYINNVEIETGKYLFDVKAA